MSSIKDKTVLITGGASGIGKLMGEKLLKAGAKQLVIWDINRENLDKTCSKLKTEGFTVFSHVIDISDTDKVIESAKTVPFVKGILPTRAFDWFAGRVLGIYKSMDKFVGHEGKNHGKN